MILRHRLYLRSELRSAFGSRLSMFPFLHEEQIQALQLLR